MNRQKIQAESQNSPGSARWLLLSLFGIGVHQVQSLILEPQERTFRITVLTIIGLTPLTLFLPKRARGIIWMLLGTPPTFGAFAGHLIPIVRDRRVPPASKTAPLNLAGGAFLTTLGAALAFSPAKPDER
ncbi:MAG: hypothetical protein H0U76_14785 [Ktedonobacteraceae bacterium]|nr:hypothetical protein [Ktedonobacteraceae bacterium]